MSEIIHPPELSVIIPVYNEEEVIGVVVQGWANELGRLKIDYEINVYDDHSSDGSFSILTDCAMKNPALFVHENPANRGHGPTILQGYGEAQGSWLFQVDGDNEISWDEFEDLWSKRESYDLLLGWRENRKFSAPRWIITSTARWLVRLLFGKVHDVNTPFRLIRKSALDKFLPRIPPDTFSPNVAMTGIMLRGGFRIYERPVLHQGRKTGQVSITKWKLWRAAFLSFFQTLRIAFR